MHRKIATTLALVICATIISTPGRLPGQTVWDGGGANDNWFTALNWDTNAVPNGITANVIVGAPSPTNVNSSQY